MFFYFKTKTVFRFFSMFFLNLVLILKVKKETCSNKKEFFKGTETLKKCLQLKKN